MNEPIQEWLDNRKHPDEMTVHQQKEWQIYQDLEVKIKNTATPSPSWNFEHRIKLAMQKTSTSTTNLHYFKWAAAALLMISSYLYSYCFSSPPLQFLEEIPNNLQAYAREQNNQWRLWWQDTKIKYKNTYSSIKSLDIKKRNQVRHPLGLFHEEIKTWSNGEIKK